MKIWKHAVVAGALVTVLGSARPARAAFWEDAGWGTLTVLSNAFYMPAKLVYATLGGVTGGLAYGLTLGDLDVANKIWVPSLAGTYVITPPMLRGEEAINFVGEESSESRSERRDEYRTAPSRPRDDGLGEEPLPPR